jgi:uncharacterized protein YjiS (DUF1127 family)
MSHDLAVNATSARNIASEGILARAIDNWRARRAVSSLLKLDDHILGDMGASRVDVTWAASLPLSVNAALALEERVRQAARR